MPGKRHDSAFVYDIACPWPSWCWCDHGRWATQPLLATAPGLAGLRCSLAINPQGPAPHCWGNCAGGEKRSLQSQNSSTPAGVLHVAWASKTSNLDHGKMFCYVFSFSAANSFYKTPWDRSWSSVWLQSTQAEPGRRQRLEANQQEGAPREAGVGRYCPHAAEREIVFTILPACCK